MFMLLRRQLLLAVVTAVAGCSGTLVSQVVPTDKGPVRGISALNGAFAFRGIPFAAAPVGENRFRAPQPAPSWTEVRECFVPPVFCPQAGLHLGQDIVVGSEDCLYLSVYVPRSASPASKLPVLFFIYGGAYIFGDSVEFELYDGAMLAEKFNVVVVTANYRLSALGFFALPELAAEDPGHSTGNYAIQDQRAALQWVQRNIDAFGGDRNRVMIFGESAGAFSVCAHYVSPASAGLFHAAIMESGTCDAPQFFQPLATATKFAQDYAQAVGCPVSGPNVVSCLRAVPVGKLLGAKVDGAWPQASLSGIYESISRYFAGAPAALLQSVPVPVPALFPMFPFGPAIDGRPTGMPAMPLSLIHSGRFNKVPLIAGTNEDEGSFFVPAMVAVVKGLFFPMNDHGVALLLAHFFPQQNLTQFLQQINQYYPKSEFKNDDWRVAAVLRDYFFRCATRRVLFEASAHGVPAYNYLFNYHRKNILYTLFGDFHSAELSFVFDNPWPPVFGAFNDGDKYVAAAFNAFWTRFAADATPNDSSGVRPADNSTGLPSWPAYTASSRLTMAMNVPLQVLANVGDDVCGFWDSVPTPVY